MKITKYITLFLSVLFVGIVIIETLPGVLVPILDVGGETEYLMFGLFEISLLDDITHLLSGLFGFAALFFGYKARVKFLMLVGGYYTLDALFFIIYGFASGQSLIDNVLLNGPHIGISILCFIGLKMSVEEIKLRQ